MSGQEQGQGQTIREAAREFVQGVATAARFAGVVSMSMRLWVQPGAAGRLAGKTALGCALLAGMRQGQVDKLEAYLAALGYLSVAPCLTIKVGDVAWSEWQAADAIASTVAHWAIARGEAAAKTGEGGRWIELANGAISEKQAAVDAARRDLDARGDASLPEVLKDADYDEHVQLVVDRARSETPRRAVRLLAAPERLLARKGRLTAERGAALAQAFAAVVDRASDARRN
jgi:hypothetical protein